ncbi:hypothetical protein HDU96_002018 [Phlyctochytrium bullatum]|nr:hypothetical protein HDU96_002018 [Phlyctochytrium bullatum]
MNECCYQIKYPITTGTLDGGITFQWGNITVSPSSSLSASEPLNVAFPTGTTFPAAPISDGAAPCYQPAGTLLTWTCPGARAVSVRISGSTINPSSVSVGSYKCSGSNTCQVRNAATSSAGSGGGGGGVPSGYVSLGSLGTQPVWFVVLITALIALFLFGAGFAIYRRGPCTSKDEDENPTGRGGLANFWKRRKRSSGRGDLEIMQAMRSKTSTDRDAPFGPGTLIGDSEQRLMSNTASGDAASAIGESLRRIRTNEEPPRLSMGSLGRRGTTRTTGSAPNKLELDLNLQPIGAPGTLLGSLSLPREHHSQVEKREPEPPTIGGPGTLLGSHYLHHGANERNQADTLPHIGGPGTLLGGSYKDHDPHSIAAPGTLLGNLAINNTRDPSKHSDFSAYSANALPGNYVTSNSLTRSLDRRSRRSGNERSGRVNSDDEQDDPPYPPLANTTTTPHPVSGSLGRRKLSSAAPGGPSFMGGGDLGSGFKQSAALPSGSVVQVEDMAAFTEEVKSLTMRSHRSRTSDIHGRRHSNASALNPPAAIPATSPPQSTPSDAYPEWMPEGIPPPPDYTIGKDVHADHPSRSGYQHHGSNSPPSTSPLGAAGVPTGTHAYAEAIANPTTSAIDRVGAWVQSLERRKTSDPGPDDFSYVPPTANIATASPAGRRPATNPTAPNQSPLTSPTLSGHTRTASNSKRNPSVSRGARNYSPAPAAPVPIPGAGLGGPAGGGSPALSGSPILSAPHRRPSRGGGGGASGSIGIVPPPIPTGKRDTRELTAEDVRLDGKDDDDDDDNAPILSSATNVAAATAAISRSNSTLKAPLRKGGAGADDDDSRPNTLIRGTGGDGAGDVRIAGADDDDEPLVAAVTAAYNNASATGSLNRGRRNSKARSPSGGQRSRQTSPSTASSPPLQGSLAMLSESELAAGYVSPALAAGKPPMVPTLSSAGGRTRSTKQAHPPPLLSDDEPFDPTVPRTTRSASKRANKANPTPPAATANATSTVRSHSPSLAASHPTSSAAAAASRSGSLPRKGSKAQDASAGHTRTTSMSKTGSRQRPVAVAPPPENDDDGDALPNVTASLGLRPGRRSTVGGAASGSGAATGSLKRTGAGGADGASPSNSPRPRSGTLGRSGGGAASSSASGTVVAAQDDDDEEDESKPLASIALASLQKNLGSR